MRKLSRVVIQDRVIEWLDAAGTASNRVSVESPTATLPAEALAAALSAARAHSSLDCSVIVSLPASWCYLQRVELAQRRPSPSALRYALEESLAENIDDLSCDFLPLAPGVWLAAAIPQAVLDRLTAAFRLSSLALERIELEIALPPAESEQAQRLSCDADHWVIASQRAAGSADVRVLRFADDTALSERCQAARDAGLTPHADLSIARSITSEQAAEIGAALCASEVALAQVAATPTDTLAFVLGRERSDVGSSAPRARRAAERLLVCSLIALLLITAVIGSRSGANQRRLQAITAWEAGVFRELFPGDLTPAAPALRIHAARKAVELQAKAGITSGPDSADPLETLLNVLAAIPPELRLQVEELRVDGTSVTLRGNTREHADAEALSQALDRLPRLRCTPPRTDRRREGGVRLALVGQVGPQETEK